MHKSNMTSKVSMTTTSSRLLKQIPELLLNIDTPQIQPMSIDTVSDALVKSTMHTCNVIHNATP